MVLVLGVWFSANSIFGRKCWPDDDMRSRSAGQSRNKVEFNCPEIEVRPSEASPGTPGVYLGGPLCWRTLFCDLDFRLESGRDDDLADDDGHGRIFFTN